MSKSKFLVLAVVVLLKVAAAFEIEENPNYPKIQDEESTQLPGDVNQDELFTISDLTEDKEDKVRTNNSTTLNVRRWAPWSSGQPNPAGQASGNPLNPSSSAGLPQQLANQPISSQPDSWTPASTWMAQVDKSAPSSPSAWMAQAPTPQTWMAQPSSAPAWPNQPAQPASSLPPWMMPAQSSPLSSPWPTQPSSSVPGAAVWMNQPEGGNQPMMPWMTQTEKPAPQSTWSGQPEKSAPQPTWSDQSNQPATPSTWAAQPEATSPTATSWGSQPEQPTYNPQGSSPAQQTQPQDSYSRLGQPQNQMNPAQSHNSGKDFSQNPTAQEYGKTGAQRPALATGLPDFGSQPMSPMNDPKSFPQMNFYEEDHQQNFSQGKGQPGQAQQPSQSYGVPQAMPEMSQQAQPYGADHSSLPGGSQINQTRDDMHQANMGDLKSMGQQLIDSHNKFGAGLAEFIMKCSDGKDSSQMLKNFGPFYILAGGFPFEGKWTE